MNRILHILLHLIAKENISWKSKYTVYRLQYFVYYQKPSARL